MAPGTRSLPVLTLEGAEVIAAACQAKARTMGIDFNIAITDATLYPLHFTRMPGAKLTSVAIATDKAFTAAGHKLPTTAYAGAAFQPGGPAFGIAHSNGGRFSTIGGGLPVVVDGAVVGGVGVSTGTPAQDEEVARAGVEEFQRWRQAGRAKL